MNTCVRTTRWWLVVLLCVVTAGCVDAAARQSGRAEEPAGVSPEVERQIADCLEDAGFEPTPPKVDEDGRFTEALEQCVTSLGVRDEFFDEPDPGEQEEERVRHNENVLAYVACMRDRGWQVPDPVPDADGFLMDQEPVGLDPAQQTAFAGDLRRCGESTLGDTMEPAGSPDVDHDHGDHDHGDHEDG